MSTNFRASKTRDSTGPPVPIPISTGTVENSRSSNNSPRDYKNPTSISKAPTESIDRFGSKTMRYSTTNRTWRDESGGMYEDERGRYNVSGGMYEDERGKYSSLLDPQCCKLPIGVHRKSSAKGPRAPYPGMDYVPKRHKAKIVVWADLTVDALDRLNESLNAEHIKHVLADIFVLDNYKESVKTGIVMDLYFYTLQFCRDQSFSPEKTSAFFSIIKKIFEVCIETPFGNLDHTFEYFKDLIHCHSINRPPYSIELFTPDEVRKMTEYTINSFFRHFKMYKYAFTPLVRLDLSVNYIGMPPSPPPSETGDKTETSSPAGDGETLDENKEEEVDEEKQQARDDLRNMVKNFIGAEAKRIEGNMDTHIKSVVDALNTQVDSILGVSGKAEGKAKKK